MGDKQLIGLLMDFLPHLGKVLEETEGEGDAAYLACSSREVVCRKLEMLSQGSENPGEEICADLEEYCEEGDFHEPEAPRVDRQFVEECLADSKAAQTEGRRYAGVHSATKRGRLGPGGESCTRNSSN